MVIGYCDFMWQNVMTVPILTPQEHGRAVGMHDAGLWNCTIAQHSGCHHSKISKPSIDLQHTATTEDWPQPGQCRVTVPRQDHHIVPTHLHTQPAACTAPRNEGRGGSVSTNTIRCRLQAAGFHARCPYMSPILAQCHRSACLNWCNRHQYWNKGQWRYLVFRWISISS